MFDKIDSLKSAVDKKCGRKFRKLIKIPNPYKCGSFSLKSTGSLTDREIGYNWIAKVDIKRVIAYLLSKSKMYGTLDMKLENAIPWR